ncbi:diacylglycerol/lipid kinase family protein [Mariniphaga sp.]|uniref:diacylglycerol/lipid kinase family protein n=1 Tax=Mariniphaga sp. TaxID=1954475 RepID=UPI003561CC27
MKNSSKKRILFVINPKSGRGQRQDIDEVVSRFSEEFKFDFQFYRTTGEGDKEKIRQHIKEYQPDTVMAVGGDGTVNMVAGELIGHDIKLGIIPAGSANGLAYNLEIPENLEAALKKNLSGKVQSIDVIRINKKYYCLHLGDIGLNARIVKRFEKEGSKGMLGYGKQLFKELFEGKTYFSFYIKLPEHRRKKMKAEMLVIANAKSFGTGAIINPTGKLNDGKFEIVIIRPYPWWFIFTFIYSAFSGNLHKMNYIKIYSASEAIITLPKVQEFQIDGEIIPETKEINVEILHNSLKLACG